MASYLPAKTFKNILWTKPHLIDIQDPEDFAVLNPYDAVNVPYDKLLLHPEKYLRKRVIYYLLCPEGSVAFRASAILEKEGYVAQAVEGGYDALLSNSTQSRTPPPKKAGNPNPLASMTKPTPCIPCMENKLRQQGRL